VVEIDPVVHDYATEYFNLPTNHTAVKIDAVPWVAHKASIGPEHYSYDYIIHDVFTGGAEPVDLFTFEFISNLSKLLRSDGVIAIVGDIRQ
jgi:spermidine synthase